MKFNDKIIERFFCSSCFPLSFPYTTKHDACRRQQKNVCRPDYRGLEFFYACKRTELFCQAQEICSNLVEGVYEIDTADEDGSRIKSVRAGCCQCRRNFSLTLASELIFAVMQCARSWHGYVKSIQKHAYLKNI